MDLIRVRGARTHNLKNVDVDIPRDKLVVITGLSGSGKSSLAFDTLYAEGQRRYVESLSAYARQFLQLMEKPDVDSIEGLSPAIAIEQKSASHNPRSTVGTVTEIHDYLRLLYARVGQPHCPDHPQQALAAQSVAQMVDAALALPAETAVQVLAPVARERKGEFAELFADLQAQGFVRFRVDGALVTGDALPALAKHEKHSIDVVVDRLRIRPQARQRLAESFETALRIAHGRAVLADLDRGTETVFSNRYACPLCGYSMAELHPRLFSFNNPIGACPACDGLGTTAYFDPRRVVAHPELSLASGAIRGWDARNRYYFQMLEALAKHAQVDLEQPWERLPEAFRELVLHGTGAQAIAFTYTDERGRRIVRRHPFEGVLPNMERRWRETDSAAVREELGKYRAVKPCPECAGTRLKREARFVFVGSGDQRRAIYEVERQPLAQVQAYFEALRLAGSQREIGARIVREIAARLRFLNDVGLGYLTLERAADTLSGGELQRIRLASQIGSGLTGVMYVLDEPSIGLHQRDNGRLIATLHKLRDLGNTVLVVEHDEDAIRAADHVIDMGPGAGEHGGRVVAQGAPADIAAARESLTGAYL
ncbi:MAG TPA: excinuclease ABC subunit UvrA, partial [Burkholderiaceae bacterium]|nr:excinuclease ABC subunit UvrA [Burkholderiaceae bacterium]